MAKQLEYVAIVRDLRTGTTSREYFRAADDQEAKARYEGIGDGDGHGGPITVRIVGVVPLSSVRAGSVVSTLNPNDTVGVIGHVVTGRVDDPRARCFFE